MDDSHPRERAAPATRTRWSGWRGALVAALAAILLLAGLSRAIAVLGPRPAATPGATATPAAEVAAARTAGVGRAPLPALASLAATPLTLPTTTPAASPAATPAAAATPQAAPTPQAPATPSTAPGIGPYHLAEAEVQARVDSWLAALSPEEKVGQLLILGFQGADAESARTQVADLHAGGVVLLDNAADADAALALTGGLQALVAQAGQHTPLLIAVDHEGGSVQRIRGGAAVFPGNMALGATFQPEHARLQGQVQGQELRALGITVNLAPVLDVNDEPSNPVIGARSYGSDPTWAARLGRAYVEGLQAQGVLAVGKHFPGHGSATQDSHQTLPSVDESLETLRAKELVPFAVAVEAGVGAIMTAHVLYPQVDPDNPATLSPRLITDVLRGELGFDGLVITDDLGAMKAITERYSAGDAALAAIHAGADALLIEGPPERQQAAYQALLGAVQDGTLPADRLDASVRRVLRAKALYDMGNPGRAAPRDSVGSDAHVQAALTVASDAVTLVRDPNGLLPAGQAGAGRAVVISPSVDAGEGMREALTQAGWTADPLVPFQMDAAAITALKPRAVAAARDADLVVLGTVDAGPAQQDLVAALAATGRPLVVIGLDLPYEAETLPDSVAYVAAYGATREQGIAAARLILGQVRGGWLPVAVSERYPPGWSAHGAIPLAH